MKNILWGEKMTKKKVVKIIVILLVIAVIATIITLIVIGCMPDNPNKDYCDDGNGCTVGGKSLLFLLSRINYLF